MLPQTSIETAMGKGCGISLVEHAGHLYTTKEIYLSDEYLEAPEVVFDDKNNRMDDYISYIGRFKADGVKLGLEVEVFSDGNITLNEVHAGYWDILIGAVHFMPGRYKDDYVSGFLWTLEAFANAGVDILAHPFRIFSWQGVQVPRKLYEPTIEILKKSGMAAELNFHYNSPDEEFFKMCIEEGVKISLGSDAHSVYEVCDLAEHFRLLRSICGSADLEKVLYYP